ncbi:MAG: ABC transporter ATP-binding protein [Chitinophagales bacterium]|nr:ABC transporter ATP-binding protein [Chitinophagales bacterium]
MKDGEALVEVKNLSKSYFLEGKEHAVLSNISFTLHKNESLGLIGNNGSGKSTLLKILSGLVKPSSGEVIIRGKVNSLIEIGSNFIPELTGRENVKQFLRLNGIDPDAQNEKIEEIYTFSGLETFFDQPVKYYSSGMFVRLAIASGFHIDADIFFIDEVLMAGDEQFRRKISNYFKYLIDRGVCLILASHNPKEILLNCKKAIWLEKGKLNHLGTAEESLDLYRDYNAKKRSEDNFQKLTLKFPHTADRFEDILEEEKYNHNLKIHSFSIEANLDKISYEKGFAIKLCFTKNELQKSFHPFFKIYDADMSPIIVLTPSNDKEIFDGLNQAYRKEINISCFFPANILTAGVYYLELMIGEDPKHNEIHTKEAFKLNDKIKFEVKSESYDFTGDTHNIFIRPKCLWQLT